MNSTLDQEAEGAFRYGLHFEHAAAQLFDGARGNTHLIIPHFVNLAFAIELFMKCLVLLEQKTPERTHLLLKLYKAMSPASRKSIEEKYLELIRLSPLRKDIEQTEHGRNIRFDDIEWILNESGDAFQTWRYAYQTKPQKGNHGMAQIREAVKERIFTMRPAFKAFQ